MPLRNAFVPIPDIIQIPEKFSSDSCTKYATHIAPLLVRDAAYGGQLCTHSGQRNDWKCAPRCSAHLQRKEYFYFAFVALCGVLQTLFSQKGCKPGAAAAACLYDPTPVKGQFSQARRFELQIKIIIPLIMAKAQQKPFKIVPLPGDSSKQAAKSYDTRGLLKSRTLLPLFYIE